MNLNPFKKHSADQAKTPRLAPRDNFMHEVRGDPFLDWALILGLSLVLTLGLVGAGVYVYLGTSERLSSPTEDKTKGATGFDATALQSVLAEFEALSEEQDALRRGYNAPRDPSLP